MPRKRGPRRRGGASSSRGAADSSRGAHVSSSTQAAPSTTPPFNKPKFSDKWTVEEILDFLELPSTSQCPLQPHSPRGQRSLPPESTPPSPRNVSLPPSPRDASPKTTPPPSPRDDSQPTIPPPCSMNQASPKTTPPPSTSEASPKTTLPRAPSEQNKAFAKWTLQESRFLISLIERHKIKVHRMLPEDQGWEVLASHLPNKTASDLRRNIFFVQLAIYFMERLNLKSKESEAAAATDVAANSPSAEASSSQNRKAENISAAARTKRTTKVSAASTSLNEGTYRASDQKISTVRMDRFADNEEAALDPCGNETELAPVAPPEAVGTCSDESELQQPSATGTLVIFSNRGEPMSFPTMPQAPGSVMDSTILSGDIGDEPINEGEIEVRVPLGRISDYRFLSPLTASSSTGTPEISAPQAYSTRGAGSSRGGRGRRSRQ